MVAMSTVYSGTTTTTSIDSSSKPSLTTPPSPPPPSTQQTWYILAGVCGILLLLVVCLVILYRQRDQLCMPNIHKNGRRGSSEAQRDNLAFEPQQGAMNTHVDSTPHTRGQGPTYSIKFKEVNYKAYTNATKSHLYPLLGSMDWDKLQAEQQYTGYTSVVPSQLCPSLENIHKDFETSTAISQLSGQTTAGDSNVVSPDHNIPITVERPLQSAAVASADKIVPQQVMSFKNIRKVKELMEDEPPKPHKARDDIPLHAGAVANKGHTKGTRTFNEGPVANPRDVNAERWLQVGRGDDMQLQPCPALLVQKKIGPTGGTLSVCGVQINIPAGSLEKEENVGLEILTDSKYYPQLNERETLLSPVVSCTPHGLTFKAAVQLSIPHCAEDINTNWKVHVKRSETETTKHTSWQSSTPQDYVQKEITDRCLKLRLHHFTLYTFVGESGEEKVAVKRVILVAFAPVLKVGRPFSVRVYCINHYQEDMQTIKSIEDSGPHLGGSLADSPKFLFFHDGGGNLCINIRDIKPEDWQLQQDANIQHLLFNDVWNGHLPSCSFTLRTLTPQDEVLCTVVGYQETREDSQRYKIHIAQSAVTQAESL